MHPGVHSVNSIKVKHYSQKIGRSCVGLADFCIGVGETKKYPAEYARRACIISLKVLPFGQQKTPPERRRYCWQESDGPLNLVGTEASGTSVHMARSPVDNGLHPLHIGLPSPICTSVGVGNLNTEGHALATIITFCHSLHLPSA